MNLLLWEQRSLWKVRHKVSRQGGREKRKGGKEVRGTLKAAAEFQRHPIPSLVPGHGREVAVW